MTAELKRSERSTAGFDSPTPVCGPPTRCCRRRGTTLSPYVAALVKLSSSCHLYFCTSSSKIRFCPLEANVTNNVRLRSVLHRHDSQHLIRAQAVSPTRAPISKHCSSFTICQYLLHLASELARDPVAQHQAISALHQDFTVPSSKSHSPSPSLLPSHLPSVDSHTSYPPSSLISRPSSFLLPSSLLTLTNTSSLVNHLLSRDTSCGIWVNSVEFRKQSSPVVSNIGTRSSTTKNFVHVNRVTAGHSPQRCQTVQTLRL